MKERSSRPRPGWWIRRSYMGRARWHGASNPKHIMTTDGDIWGMTDGGTSGVTCGVTHGAWRPDTLELQFPLLISIGNNEIAPVAISCSRRLMLPLPLMLRSIAARRERRRFRTPNVLRCVSKHGGHAAAVLILRDARTRVRVCETSRHPRSSG